MRLLYAFQSGGNGRYFELVLRWMSVDTDIYYRPVKPPAFLTMEDLNTFDVVVYQTFPNEKQTAKFMPELVKKTDAKFLGFNGFKILFDTHDWPEENAYTRFTSDYPRVKHIPGEKYREGFNVILAIPHNVNKKLKEIPAEIERPVLVHCAPKIGVYPHRIRETMLEVLKKKYSSVTFFQRIPNREYETFLRGVRITATADGFGPSAASVQSLQSGTLLFTHEQAIHGIQMLPHADLVDGEDYVSFNFENFDERLNWLLSNPGEVDRIRKSGQRKFFEGHDYGKSADQFRKYLERML